MRIVTSCDKIQQAIIVDWNHRIHIGGKAWFILNNSKLVDVSKDWDAGARRGKRNDHIGISTVKNYLDLFGLKQSEINSKEIISSVLKNGHIRVRIFENSTCIETNSVDTNTLKKLQELFYKKKLEFNSASNHYWSGLNGSTKKFKKDEFLLARSIEDLTNI